MSAWLNESLNQTLNQWLSTGPRSAIQLRILTLALLVAACSVLSARAAHAQHLWPEISLALVEDGFMLPVHIAMPDDGSNRLFVVEKAGRIQIIQDGAKLPTPFLDINDRVGYSCNECGLLSVAFPPDYAENGYFFVYYTTKTSVIEPDQPGEADGEYDAVLARFWVSDDPNSADPDSEERILLQNQPADNHNGGQLAFGPDGMLYVGSGDGGGREGANNGQRLSTLLGKILRIEVGASGTYTVPADNPFVGQADVKPEIWAYGLRNPWRFAFDSASGDLYIGDVGQGHFEEINRQPADSSGGENYGWDEMEGLHCHPLNSDCDPDQYVLPIAEYDHSQDDCSVTGGVVYASKMPGLVPVYLYGDYCSGRIRGLQPNGDVYTTTLLLDTETRITSFGQDQAGNSYVVDYNGAIYRIEEAPWPTLILPLLRLD